MADVMFIENMQIVNIAIDSVTFYGANYLVAVIIKMERPDLTDILSFVVGDFLGRWIYGKQFGQIPISFQGMLFQQGYVNALYVAFSIILDIITEKKSLGTAFKQNIVRGAVGTVANSAVDNLILSAKYR